MPFSTFNAVRTPGSDSPNSTSMIATAACMPTTTAAASTTRDTLAMLPSIRPIAGDVDARDAGARLHDHLEEVIHHDLRAGAAQRAEQRKHEDTVAQLHRVGRQLQNVLLLAQEDLFAALLIELGRVKPETVE